MPLHAQGIAVSKDGKIWLAGTGTYGNGWGNVGKGVSIQAGATLFIKYTAAAATSNALQIAPHGSDAWEPFGPQRSGKYESKPAEAIVLKVEKLGTPQSTAAWINGPNTISAGIISSGAYDLRLGPQSSWTLPPITVTPKTPWWEFAFFRLPASTVAADPVNASVPDRGTTLLLLGVGLAAALLCWRIFQRRRPGAH